MDPLTIFVGVVLTALTVGAGFIFDRQEKRIKALEEREATKDAQHTACREEVAVLRARVQELERMLGVEHREDAE